MGRLSEYIQMVGAGIKNIDKVAEGLLNVVKDEFGTLPEDEQEEIARRRLICSTCPFSSSNAVGLGIYKTQRVDEHCIHCHCPIVTKTASLHSNCGIENYNVRNPNNRMELKWEAYKK